MRLLGLPEADWPRYAAVWHDVFAAPQDPAVYQALGVVRDELRGAVRARSGCPVHDVLGSLGRRSSSTAWRPSVARASPGPRRSPKSG
jgi:hypothetical protein